ncbi:MAG: S4 domain-containing protein, partial [bacterium]|nr:S4 domain-containing protein [bacterium]
FELLTDIPSPKTDPREAKAQLAKEVIKVCHNQKEAELAEKEFERVFRDKELPTEIPKVAIKEGVLNILDLLVETKLCPSKSEAKRLVEQGGVEVDGKIKKDWREQVEVKQGQIIRVGKRKFVEIK